MERGAGLFVRGALFVKAGGAALLASLLAGTSAQARPEHVDAIMQLGGATAGSYFEDTREAGGRITDTVKQSLVLNRLGSRVVVEEMDVFEQDTRGGLLGMHVETSSSRDSVTTDLVVKGGALELTNRTGGKSYTRRLPFEGQLIGPAGVRRLMLRIREGPGTARYQTFIPALGGLAKATLTYQGAEPVEADGRSLQGFRYLEAIDGYPGAVAVWVDADGYTLRAVQGTPFGPVTTIRGHAPAAVLAAGAELPAEVYERTVAVSNIRLPHARRLDEVTVELTKKPDAEDGWPDFASPNQQVLSRTPRRLVLRIARAGQDGAADAGPPTPDDLAPNALVQSDLPEVKRLARGIVGGESDPWKAALKLHAWTARHMVFDAGIAAAPAGELVRDRHGTCLGYSILLASLARADGVPARIRMGYVYVKRSWGGHAWVEVYAHGRWLPLDAAVYYPGVADAARIAATVDTGAGGALSGVGELARLYGRIEVKTLGYRLAGSETEVKPQAPDHTVSGEVYLNPWLGLRVVKPAGTAFTHLDDHWPSNEVLGIDGPAGSVSIHQEAGLPDDPLADQLRRALAGAPGGAPPPDAIRPAMWRGAPIVRVRERGVAMIALRRADELWIVLARGTDPDVLLDQALPGISIEGLGA